MGKKDNQPKVSVVIPMRNMEKTIEETLGSILMSGEDDLEVIVVDDGSTDSSVEKVHSVGDSRIRIIPGPCRGVAASLQAGFDAALGLYIARCDADDLHPPGRLAKQLEFLEANQEFGAICGGFTMVNHKGRFLVTLGCDGNDQEITEELRNGLARTHFGTFLVRREVIQGIGGCRQWFERAEDIDLQLRIGCSTRVWYLVLNSYLYRLHDRSWTHSTGRKLWDWYEEQAQRFARQRSATGSDDLQKGQPPKPPEDDAILIGSVADQVSGILLGAAWREHGKGRRLHALSLGLRATAYKPFDISIWRSVAALLIKR